jgi:hypothetical protein
MNGSIKFYLNLIFLNIISYFFGICSKSCKKTTCENLDLFSCGFLFEDKTVLDVCPKDYYCPFLEQTGSTSLKCKSKPSTKSYPGSFCVTNSNCISNFCSETNTCLGYNANEECRYNEFCPFGYSCQIVTNSTEFKCLKLKEEDEFCLDDYYCSFGMGCFNEKCRNLFTLETGTQITNNSTNPLLCASGYIFNNKCEELELLQPFNSTCDNFCTYRLSNNETASVGEFCNCGFNSEGKSFCFQGTKNLNFIKYLETVKILLSNSDYLSEFCNTVERDGICDQFIKYNKTQAFLNLKKEYINSKILSQYAHLFVISETCVVQAVFPDYQGLVLKPGMKCPSVTCVDGLNSNKLKDVNISKDEFNINLVSFNFSSSIKNIGLNKKHEFLSNNILNNLRPYYDFNQNIYLNINLSNEKSKFSMKPLPTCEISINNDFDLMGLKENKNVSILIQNNFCDDFSQICDYSLQDATLFGKIKGFCRNKEYLITPSYIKYPGEVCNSDQECLSQICFFGKCSGSKLGDLCDHTFVPCQLGLTCIESVCQSPKKINETCSLTADCENTLLCFNSRCIELFSLPIGTDLKLSSNDVSQKRVLPFVNPQYYCETFSVSQDMVCNEYDYEEEFLKTHYIDQEGFINCTYGEMCRFSDGRYIYEVACQCGNNPDGIAYCYRPNKYKLNTVKNLQDFLKDYLNNRCHSSNRFNCPLSSQHFHNVYYINRVNMEADHVYRNSVSCIKSSLELEKNYFYFYLFFICGILVILVILGFADFLVKHIYYKKRQKMLEELIKKEIEAYDD